MNIKLVSPLYFYTLSELKTQGVKNIGKTNIQKAYDAVSLLINNCCELGFPKTKSRFLNNFYTLLKLANTPKDLNKLKQVKKILEPHTTNTCC